MKTSHLMQSFSASGEAGRLQLRDIDIFRTIVTKNSNSMCEARHIQHKVVIIRLHSCVVTNSEVRHIALDKKCKWIELLLYEGFIIHTCRVQAQ
jgi:hypothetical protein